MLRVLDFITVSLLLMTIATAVRCRNTEYLNPEWVDPHDWTVEKDPLNKLCPQTQTGKPCENSAKSEYLRLVNSLFNPSEFRFDESTNYLYRTVHIHITKEQLEKLKKSNNPIDIDGLVSEVLAQTEFGTVQLVKEYTVDVASTIWEHMPSLPSLQDIPSFSEINFNALPRSRPILINFVVMILSYIFCRRYGINYLIFLLFVLIYCLYEYLDYECHRRIELNEAVDFIYGKEKNPCSSPTKMNWYDWLLGKDSRSACRDFLDKQSAHKTQCGVVDLFHEFYTGILMKQLKIFFMTIAELVQTISTTNGVLITAVIVYFMKDLLVTIIQSVFKYVVNPTVWSRVAADINSSTPEPVLRVQPFLESDPRDVNVSKALDLANQQMKYILESNKMAQIQPSGVEVLSIRGVSVENSTSDLAPSTSSEVSEPSNGAKQTNGNTPSSDGSGDSYEKFAEDEIIISQNISVVSVGSTTQSSEISSEYSATMSTDDINSSKICDKSGSTSVSSSDSTKSGDSLEILSISSDTTPS
ncbi:uncharacterized protein LOC129569618 [Sitodiplosis mosellana]|uniref:uncharacterized protein LOC129569618 n=1 Tax=Sitodiplosis mosellana TaxID=263140 RepID=UPI002444BDA4|nr:uncharacterized protein LOC129569618 [Sitodiplosis mosellana]